MSNFTTTQAGNWGTGATWVGGSAPSSSDTATINHAVTIEADKTIAGLAINAALTVAATKTLTLTGNCTHGNTSFTLNADSGLVFDTTSGNVKWLFGSANNQQNCKIVTRGTSGHYATISKTGSNYSWFDIGDEGAGGFAECGGWDAEYLHMSGMGKSDHSFAVGLSSFGALDIIFKNCLLEDNEGVILYPRPYAWSANGGGDFIFTDNTVSWTNTSHQGFYLTMSSNAPTGTVTVARNIFDPPEGLTFGAPKISTHSSVAIDDCIFLGCPELLGHGHINRPLICLTSNGQTLTPSTDLTDWYVLIDHIDPNDRDSGTTNVGNSHTISMAVGGKTIHGLVFDCVNFAPLIDGPDNIFGTFGAGTTVEYCLNLPMLESAGEGNGSLVSFYSDVTGWSNLRMLHNTVVGADAQATFMEIGFSGSKCTEFKSNLISDPAPTTGGAVGTNGAHYLLDFDMITAPYTNPADLIDPAGLTYNYIFNPEAFTDPDTSISHAGYIGKMTGSLSGTNIVDTSTGPDFVDPTRNFPAWAVHKGAATVGQTRRQKIDAGKNLLRANPLLAYTDLLPWVRAGWSPRNSALNNAGHDGITIGAVAFGGSGGGGGEVPPPASNVVFAGFRQAAAVARRS